MTAAILVGGLGSRLRSAVADRPKALSEVRGRPFLAYLLDQLAAVDVRSVVLCTGHLGQQVYEAFGDSYGGMRLSYSREKTPLGTAGALRLALPFFDQGPDEADPLESVLAMNGDSFCEVDLGDFWACHRSRETDATLVMAEVPSAAPYGRLQVDADGHIRGFDEKDAKGGPGWINAGIYLLSRRLLGTIPEGRPVSLEREMFPSWIGRNICGYRSAGRFIDIGTPERYASAERFFAMEPRT